MQFYAIYNVGFILKCNTVFIHLIIHFSKKTNLYELSTMFLLTALILNICIKVYMQNYAQDTNNEDSYKDECTCHRDVNRAGRGRGPISTHFHTK